MRASSAHFLCAQHLPPSRQEPRACSSPKSAAGTFWRGHNCRLCALAGLDFIGILTFNFRMTLKNAKVDSFIQSEKKWGEVIRLLRQMALESGLTEEFKWRLPCYLYQGKNVAIIQNFKSSCALMFFDGHKLKDAKKILKAPGENSQTARRFEFTKLEDVTKLKTTIRAYLKEAIKLSQVAQSLPKKPAKLPAMPAELKQALAANKKLSAAFAKLTPGRQRQYLIHVSSAKQAATRVSRVEKCLPRILKGQGLTDR